MSFYVVIPARYQSSRLPGKVLLDIAGKPMLQHVYERAQQSLAQDVLIATDSDKVKTVAESFGAKVFMTAETHASGTDRIAQVVAQQHFGDDDIIINVQGDEPLIPPSLINLVALTLKNNSHASVSTLAEPILEQADYFNTHIVKVVMDKLHNALYFSRASIPWFRDAIDMHQFKDKAHCLTACYKHIGIYAYRAKFIKHYFELEKSPLEAIESLEQLRVLWHGFNIQVAITDIAAGVGVDTEQDLEKVRTLFSSSVLR